MEEMSVCGGTQPSTASLTFLLQDESEEVMKSIQSPPADLPVLASVAKDETSQQLSQDGDLDLCVAGTAVIVAYKGAPDLGEGGRTGSRAEGQQLPPRP